MRCAGCRADVPGGTEGCRAVFAELLAPDCSNIAYGRSHRLMVDTYAMQHPDTFCASAKSFAAPLGGLCCAIENGADPEIYRALQRWLNGRSPVEKPAVPSF